MPLQKPRIFFQPRPSVRSVGRSLALANPGRDCVRVCRPLCALAAAGVSQPWQSNVPGLFRLYTPLYSVSRDSITRDPQPSNGARRKSFIYTRRAPAVRVSGSRRGSERIPEKCVSFFFLFLVRRGSLVRHGVIKKQFHRSFRREILLPAGKPQSILVGLSSLNKKYYRGLIVNH